MSNRHFFISYSTADAQEFAIKLHDELEGGYPKYEAWLDKRDLVAGVPWPKQLDNAIRDCGALLFVMTPDSVTDSSGSTLEWSRALSYKKTIVPIRLIECVEPYLLQNRQYIDFSDFSAGIVKLREYLEWVNSPAGELQRMRDELEDMQRQLIRVSDNEVSRIKKAMADLEERIKEQEFVVNHPNEAAERTEKSVEAAIQRARQPKDKPKSRTKFINHPPATVPSYFKDRDSETDLLIKFLNDARHRVFHLVGRAGIGKTAVTVRLLKHLEGGKLPDENGEMTVDGIVYLSQVGSRTLKTEYLYPDLCRLLPDEAAEKLDALYREPKTSTADKMKALLSHFPPEKLVLVLLDNFEDVVEHETQDITDSELDEALRALVDAPPHGVKVLITTRVLANKLYLRRTERQRQHVIGEGLIKPFAEEMLREMDESGTLGLKDAPLEKLSEAADKVRRYPRALEALVGWMEVDVTTTLDDVLNFADGLLPENVVEELVARAFDRLDTSAQQVIQGLAIFGRPVSSGAVDALLEPYKAGINSAPVLRRLLNWHFVRQEHGLYTLHPVDRQYALGLISRGEDSDRFEAETPPFTQIALYNIGANHFVRLRKPREEWKTIADLEPQLAEFDLRCKGKDWNNALDNLKKFDNQFLYKKGHYRELIGLCQQLLLDEFHKEDQQYLLGLMGKAHTRLSQINEAIECFNKALSIVEELNLTILEAEWNGRLGRCYREIMMLSQAEQRAKKALKLTQMIEADTVSIEAYNVDELGYIARAKGEIHNAIDYYNQAIKIAASPDKSPDKATSLGNLGDCYALLGDSIKSKEYYIEALRLFEKVAYLRGLNIAKSYYALTMVDELVFEPAIELCEEIITADTVQSPKAHCGARWVLALAYLSQDELPEASQYIQKATRYNVPSLNYLIVLTKAIITIRQGDTVAARKSFETALEACDEMLAKTPELYDVKDAKGLALCGLAVVENNPARVLEAKAVFREVRSYTADLKGHIGRIQRQFDALAKADDKGLLVGVREAIGGE